MTLKPWRKLSDELVNKNPWWEYRLAKYTLPNGKPAEYHYVHDPDAVAVVPIGGDGKITIVRQYRALVDRMNWELPIGGMEQSDSPEQMAREELRDETNLQAGEMESIGAFQISVGRVDSHCHVFIASDLSFLQGKPDDTEEFEIKQFSGDAIDEMIRSGELNNGMSIASWHLARPRVLEIIDQMKGN